MRCRYICIPVLTEQYKPVQLLRRDVVSVLNKSLPLVSPTELDDAYGGHLET